MSRTPTEVAMDFFARLRADQLDGAAALLSPALITHDMPPGAPSGKEGALLLFRQLFGAFPDLRFTVEDVIAQGDKLAVRLTAQGRHQGPFMGVPATGKPVVYKLVEVVRVSGGLIVERWGVADWMSLLVQLG